MKYIVSKKNVLTINLTILIFSWLSFLNLIGCRSVAPEEYLAKYNKYVEEKFNLLKAQGKDYYFIQLASSEGGGFNKVCYFAFQENKQFFLQKITVYKIYKPIEISDFSKYMDGMAHQESYNWSMDTASNRIFPHRAYLNLYLYYYLEICQNKNIRKYELLMDQIFDTRDVPGRDFIRQFIMSVSWTEMTERYMEE